MALVDPSEISLLKGAYAAFNARDIDAALLTMQADVAWPNGMEGGYVHGHAEIREYWTRQWAKFDPHVEPLAFDYDDSGRVLVDVHQVVRDLAGAVLFDQQVRHLYTIRNGQVKAMEICAAPRKPWGETGKEG